MIKPEDTELFGFAFNSGPLAATQLLKGLDGPTLDLATRAVEAAAADRVMENTSTPLEDYLLKIDPFVASLRKLIDEAANGK